MGLNEGATGTASCVGIAVRSGHAEADAAAALLSRLLAGRGVKGIPYDEVTRGAVCDFVMVLGGDGTLLQVANQMAPRRIPVIGVNFGRVGYLCEVDADRLSEAVDRLVCGNFQVEARTMVRATVRRKERPMKVMDALNEILIGGATRTLTLHVAINGVDLGQIRGDGLIVATRTGSTAYSFSAGGSILLLDGFVLVASNAVLATSIRSLILPTDSMISVTDQSWSTTPYVTADGQRDYRIRKGDVVEITRSPLHAYMVTLGLSSQVRKLGQGFGLRRSGAENPSGPDRPADESGAGLPVRYRADEISCEISSG